MAEADLFVWLAALWTKARPEGTFPVYVAHRFLASDRLYAPVARRLSREIREPDLVFGTWQGLLPLARGAPRLSYPAAKKGPAAEALVTRVMTVEGIRRAVAEEQIALAALTGALPALRREYGIEEET